jgi:hypothetical protein
LGVTMFMAKNSRQKWNIKVTPAPQWQERSRPCVLCHD